MKAGAAALLFAVFITGLFLGGVTDKVETKYKVIHDTETVTKTKKVKVPYVPEECKIAIEYAIKLKESATTIDVIGSSLLDLMSKSRMAIYNKDSSELNAIETDLRKLRTSTVGSVEAIGQDEVTFDAAIKGCGIK